MVSWCIITACQAAVVNYEGLVACRIFMGLVEAGFFPGCIYYLTFWYKPQERAQRMAVFAASVAVSGAFSGLLATGISSLNGKGGLFGWQWLFVLEAIPAIVTGVLVFFWMPDYPGSDKTVDWSELRQTLGNLDFWLFAIAYFCMTNSLNAVGFFLPSLRSQALMVPPNVFGALVIVANAVWSDRRNECCLHALDGLLLIGIGYILLAATSTVGPRMVGVFFIASTNAAVIPFLAFRLSTVSGSTVTAVASGATIAFANIGGVTAPYLFKSDEAPLYYTANYVIFGIQVLAGLIILLLWYRLGSSALYKIKSGGRIVQQDHEAVGDAEESTNAKAGKASTDL